MICIRKDTEAYDQVWEALTARYGHPYIIQHAFREKLNNTEGESVVAALAEKDKASAESVLSEGQVNESRNSL